jgi:hypothetical protein
MAKPKPEPKNLFDLAPRREMEFRLEESGKVTLLVPRFQSAWMRKFFLPRAKNPDIQIALDAFGSHVWLACDGEATVARIAETLRERFGEEVEPVHDRVAVFVQNLLRHRFISFPQAPELKDAK